jgi:hypothetical protein
MQFPDPLETNGESKDRKVPSKIQTTLLQRPPSFARSTFSEQHEEEYFDDLTLGELPPQSERVNESSVFKLCQGDWQERWLVLTSRELVIAFPGSEFISDKIPLVKRICDVSLRHGLIGHFVKNFINIFYCSH